MSVSRSSGHGDLATPRRARRISSVVEKTVDKLSRSVSAKSHPQPSSQSQSSPPAHRRMFSLNRRNARPQQSESNTGVLSECATNLFRAYLQYQRHRLPLSVLLDCFLFKPCPPHLQSLQMTIVLLSDPPLPLSDHP